MSKKEIFVVAHSHWDHEWYFTYEDSDIILVKNLDYLLDLLESDPEFTSYSFDGQFAVIEKYLKIRPENTDRVKVLVENRRLFIGPWYTQTDLLLVKTESVIRNLLYGYKYTEQFGHVMNIGYSPDVFGQHAYLPAVYRDFNLDYSIFQRGVYNDQVAKDLNFTWVAPNGTSIKTNNIFFGYGPGKFLSADADYRQHRLDPILRSLAEKNQSTDNILLPSGGDQVIIKKEFPEVVKELNELSDEFHFTLTDFEHFMEEAWQDEAAFETIIEGELLAGQKSRIHNTCRSERYDIKYLNYILEDQLVNVLEPLSSMCEGLGVEYPSNWIDIIWKKIFDSQAHNGIGASNSDDANHDIVVRLTSAYRQVLDLINLAKKQLTKSIAKGMNNQDIVTLFNTSARPFKGSQKVVIFSNTADFSLKSLSGVTQAFTILNQEELSGGRKIIVTAQGEKEEMVPDYYRTELLVTDVETPAMGYSTYLVEAKGEPVERLAVVSQDFIENELLRVQVVAGKVRLENKADGTIIEDSFVFDDFADGGDSFDFSPIDGDQGITLAEAELVQVETTASYGKLTLKHQGMLPVELAPDALSRKTETAPFEIETVLELRQGESFLRVAHHINNGIKDHRVRALWQTGVSDLSHSYADQGYSLVKRSSTNPYLENWRELKFVEKPMPIYPMETVVAVADQEQTFALTTGILKEYEVLEEEQRLAMTLFRGNGLLGRDDLAWRPGRASGINNKVVYTPEGQMLTEMDFSYGIYFAKEALNPATIFSISAQVESHTCSYQVQNLNSFEERIDRFEVPELTVSNQPELSLFEIDNPAIFMSSCKKAWDGNGYVARFFNPTEETQRFNFTTNSFTTLEKVNLLEETKANATNQLVLAPKDYVTLRMA